jgi:hypothetical protein
MGKARDLARLIVNSSGAIDSSNLGNAIPADGSITTAKIANSAVTAPKIGGMPRIIKVETFTNSTRQTFSATSPITYWSITYTKSSSTSHLIIDCLLTTYSNSNGGNYLGINIDGSVDWSGSAKGVMGGDAGSYRILQRRTGLSSGNRAISIYQQAADGGANMLIPVLNPNSSDDGRNRQNSSIINIYEIEP